VFRLRNAESEDAEASEDTVAVAETVDEPVEVAPAKRNKRKKSAANGRAPSTRVDAVGKLVAAPAVTTTGDDGGTEFGATPFSAGLMRAHHPNPPARPAPGGTGKDAPPPRPAREFRFDDRDFERIRRLIYAHAGIRLNDSKRDMVYGRVTRRLRATGLKSFAEYLARLEADDLEFEEFVNSLTTNLTAFFREDHHFPILADLLRRHAANGPVSLWSAACSTGEEAYSMAITAIETLGPDARVRILGTDLDTRAVRTADLGIYPLERVEKLGEERLKRFFLKGTGEK